MTLHELTGQESGIIIFEGGNIVVANWLSAADDCIPMLSPLGCDLIPFPYSSGTIEAAAKTAKRVIIRDEIPSDGEVLYDYNDDIPELRKSPETGTMFTLGKIQIIAPDDWI